MIDAATLLCPCPTGHRVSVFARSDVRFFLRAYAGGFALFLAVLA